MSDRLSPEQVMEFQAIVAVAEANHRGPSYSMHVFDWMAWKLRCKYPPVCDRDRLFLDRDVS